MRKRMRDLEPILVSSVSPDATDGSASAAWEELGAGGIYTVVVPDKAGAPMTVAKLPWPKDTIVLERPLRPAPTAGGGDDGDAAGASCDVSVAAAGLLAALRLSIRRRVLTVPAAQVAAAPVFDSSATGAGSGGSPSAASDAPARVAVLFSGGLDSVVLAALLAERPRKDDHADDNSGSGVGGGCGGGGSGGGSSGDGGGSSGFGDEAFWEPAIPEGEPVDLINVCFDRPNRHVSPDRLAARQALAELRVLYPRHVWRLVCVDAGHEDVELQKRRIWALMQPCSSTMDANIGAAFWFASRGVGRLEEAEDKRGDSSNSSLLLRPADAAPEQSRCINGNSSCVLDGKTPEGQPLESGAAPPLQPQHAWKPRPRPPSPASAGPLACCGSGCRREAKAGCTFNLCKLCCFKVQRAAQQVVAPAALTVAAVISGTASRATTTSSSPPASLCTCRASKLSPTMTETAAGSGGAIRESSASNCPVVSDAEGTMDNEVDADVATRLRCRLRTEIPAPLAAVEDSVLQTAATAFLAGQRMCLSHPRRSHPLSRQHPAPPPPGGVAAAGASDQSTAAAAATAGAFVSRARVLLVGIGADEQLAGYSRHRHAYVRGGTAALEAELAMDLGRLWRRNLGRDDRCLSDHGREARFPYLDEDVVQYVRWLSIEAVANMEELPGVGDKKVLRLVAAGLGLQSCTGLVKRAIQFGSRIAKHTNVAIHGSNRKAKGTDASKLGDSLVPFLQG
ncbi:unnamed protein product [Phaeothamnion confervicola]